MVNSCKDLFGDLQYQSSIGLKITQEKCDLLSQQSGAGGEEDTRESRHTTERTESYQRTVNYLVSCAASKC